MGEAETPFERAAIPQVVEALARGNALAERQNALLTQLLQRAGGSPAPQPASGASAPRRPASRVSSSSGATVTPGVVSMPIRPPDLVHIAQAAGNIEYGFYKIVQFPVPVSPGQTSLLEMVPEKGRSIVIEGDLLAWVDTYLAGITVPAFYLNGRQILQAQLPYIFAGATAFSGGQYVIVGEEGMVAEFYNPSDYQATVWIAAEAAHLDNDWVNKKLVPAMDVGYYETLRVVGAA